MEGKCPEWHLPTAFINPRAIRVAARFLALGNKKEQDTTRPVWISKRKDAPAQRSELAFRRAERCAGASISFVIVA